MPANVEQPFVVDDLELRRVLSAQPMEKLQRLASALGWNGLRRWHIRLHMRDPTHVHVSGGVIVYYMTTDEKFNLQINVQPHGQTRFYAATVKAERYGIINVGWHEFELPPDNDALDQLARRLDPMLRRSRFKNPRWRQGFAERHPCLVLPNRKGRWFRRLPPYHNPCAK